MNNPHRPSSNPSKEIDRKKLYIATFIGLLIFTAYSFYSSQSAIEQDNAPKIDPFWSFVVKNEQVEVYTDVVNINMENQDTDKVDYWEKIVMLEGFEVGDNINDQLLLDFDKPLESIVSHFLVDCPNQTYQRLGTVYTQIDGKKRYMNTNNEPLPAVAINEDTMTYYSSQYACQIKDMDVIQRLDTVE